MLLLITIFITEYGLLGKYFIWSFFLAFVLVMISWIFSGRVRNSNRIYSYECGFSPFTSTKLSASLHVYPVVILFVLFDIELALLLPLVFLDFSTPAIVLSVGLLLLFLLGGLVFEIYSGLLDFFRW